MTYFINIPGNKAEEKNLVDRLTQANYNHNRGKLGCPSKGMDKIFGKELAKRLEANYQKTL